MSLRYEPASEPLHISVKEVGAALPYNIAWGIPDRWCAALPEREFFIDN